MLFKTYCIYSSIPGSQIRGWCRGKLQSAKPHFSEIRKGSTASSGLACSTNGFRCRHNLLSFKRALLKLIAKLVFSPHKGCVRIHARIPHHHVQPFPKRFRQVCEVTSHSFYRYMCCMVTGILYESALVTLDPSWNNLWFLFFFPLTYYKHLQTSPDYDDNLTCEGVKKITKLQKSPVSSQMFLPLPLPRLPNRLFFFVFFFLLMCFCSL